MRTLSARRGRADIPVIVPDSLRLQAPRRAAAAAGIRVRRRMRGRERGGGDGEEEGADLALEGVVVGAEAVQGGDGRGEGGEAGGAGLVRRRLLREQRRHPLQLRPAGARPGPDGVSTIGSQGPPASRPR